jgi:hypothetical protein
MYRAAGAPLWVLMTLVVVIVASTALVATHRHTGAPPAPQALAQEVPSSAPAAGVRRDSASRSVSRSASRSGDRARGRQARPPVKPAIPLVRKPIPTLPVASSDAAETVAAAKASTYNVPGKCLSWSREQADIPSRYTDAATAWQHAHGRRAGDPNPPKGSAVYWLGGSGGYGHVAISLGNGMVRSSDAGGSGVVATVPLRKITREWHLTYVGWADTINGYRIPGVART